MKKKALKKEFRVEVKKSLNRFLSIFFIVAMGVAFFTGIHASAPDMRATGDSYFDESSLMDFRVIGTLGLTDADLEALRAIEGIEFVEGCYMEDAYCGDEQEQNVLHIESIPEQINLLTLEAGSMPENPGECFLDSDYALANGIEPGDTLEITVSSEDDSMLRSRSYIVSGYGNSPCYIAYDRGTTTLGTGKLSGFAYVVPEEFDSEVYTVAYLLAAGAKDKIAYTDEYDDLIQEVYDRLDAISDVRCEIRYEEVMDEAQEALDEGKQELEDGKQELADAKQELAEAESEAEQKLSEAESELIEGESELEKGRQELEDAKQEIADGEKELADGEAEIEANEETLADGKAQINDAVAQLNSGEAEYQSGLSQYKESSKKATKQLDKAQKQIDEGKKQLEAGWSDYYTNLAAIEDGENQLAEAEEQLADGQAQYDAAYEENKAQLDAGLTEYNAGMAQVEAGRQAYEAGKAQLQASQKEYDSGRAQLDEAWAQYHAGAEQLAQGKAQYSEAEAQIAQLKNASEAAQAAAEAALSEYNAAEANAQSAQNAYDAAEAEAAQLEADYAQTVSEAAALREVQAAAEQAKAEAEAQNDTELAAQKEQEAAQAASKAAEKENSLPAKQADIDSANAVLAGKKAEADAAAAVRAEKQAALEAANAQYAGLKAAYEAAEAELTQQGAQIEQTEAVLAATKQTLDQKEAEMTAAKEQLDAGWAQLSDSKAQLDAAEQQLAAAKTEIDAGYAALDEAKAELDAGWTQIEQKKAEIEAGKQALEKGKQTLESSEDTLNASQKKVDDGYKELSDAKKQLTAARQELDLGWAKVNSSRAQIADGEQQLADGRSQLADARAELEDARQQIADAEEEIAENEQKLKDGWEEYEDGKKEAEEEIADAKQKIKDAEEELADAEQEIADAEAEIADIKKPKWYVSDRNVLPENTGFGENAARMSSLAKVFPALFFLVAALISLTTMTRMVEEERTQIGTMKALGYSKGDIAGKYLKYAFYATIGGSICGTLFGEKVFPWVIITAYGILYTHLPKLILPYNLEFALMATGAALLCTIGATVSACRKAMQEVPAQLMRPPAPKEGKRIFLERIPFLWRPLKFTWKSTIRNLMRYKKRCTMTVIGIGGCMGLLLVGYGLRDSIMGVGTLQFHEVQKYSAMVILDTDASTKEQEAVLQKAADASDITEYGRYYMQLEEVKTSESSGREWSAYIYVPEQMDNLYEFFCFRKRGGDETYELTDDGAILTEKIAKELGIEAGDTVILEREDGDQVEIPIAAVCENYLSHYIYMTPALYEQAFGEAPDYNCLFYKSDANTETVKEIGGELLESDAVLNITYTADLEGQLTSMLVALDMVMVVLIIAAGLLAFVVLYNLNNININERRRELATLKVLGFFDGEVAAYVYRENVILTIIGAAFGCLFGKLLHLFVITTVEVDNTMFGRNINLESFVAGTLFTILFSCIVNFVMYFKLKKIDMVESLKSIE